MSDLFEKLDADGDGTLTRAEVVAGADLLGITPAEVF
jgi:Ca2+-binding EF-hand superfamily protein